MAFHKSVIINIISKACINLGVGCLIAISCTTIGMLIRMKIDKFPILAYAVIGVIFGFTFLVIAENRK